MSQKNGQAVIDEAIDAVQAEAAAEPGPEPTPPPAPEPGQPGIVGEPRDEFGVRPLGHVTEQERINSEANLALTIKRQTDVIGRQAEYIGRLQDKIRELMTELDRRPPAPAEARG